MFVLRECEVEPTRILQLSIYCYIEVVNMRIALMSLKAGELYTENCANILISCTTWWTITHG